MKPFFKIYATILLILVISFGYSQSMDKVSRYKSELLTERLAKDEEFKTDKASPLDSLSKLGFGGLNYFKPEIKWLIKARLERYSTPDTIQMKTTTERLPLYIVYGKATFKKGNNDLTLTVYRNVGLLSKSGYENYLFVPFRDETSGEETYGGGRYVDAYIEDGDDITIDFNRAYNPYCVYSKKYSCPIPPPENYLPLKVKAGEKAFDHSINIK
jgi:uncharacterized protein (DUF1684 family)